MGGTFRNDPICGCGTAIILFGLGTVYIKSENRRKHLSFETKLADCSLETEYTSSCNKTENGTLCDVVYTFTKVFFAFEIFIWFYSTFVKVIPGNHVRKYCYPCGDFHKTHTCICACVFRIWV